MLSEPGQGTTTTRFPDGFARVSFFINWITRTVCREAPGDEVFVRDPGQKLQSRLKQEIKRKQIKSFKSCSVSSVHLIFFMLLQKS
jgi:hypothetical protein